MALSITSTYAGEFAGKYISAALLSGSTISQGGIEVRPNVKYKEVIQRVEVGSAIVDSTCDFSNAGDVTLTERIIQPEEFQINLQLCKTPFVANWDAISMGYSAFDNLPPSFSDYLIGHLSAEVAAKTETNIWQGVNANAGEFDGFVTLMAADANIPAAQKITAATVTSSNVIAELGKVVDQIPSALYGKEDVHIYISQNIARAYVRALGGFGSFLNGENNSGYDSKGTMWWSNGALSFDGVKIFVAHGLADNTMVAAQKSNLYFGTGLMSDYNLVKLLDMADLDGSQNVRFIMRYTASVQYGIPEDVVVYS